MIIKNSATQGEVFSHWEKVEKLNIHVRIDLVFPLLAYGNLSWNNAVIEKKDINKIYICSSDDWKNDGLCTPDFKLTTAIKNYEKHYFSEGKYSDINKKIDLFSKNINALDTKLIFLADNPKGPFTVLEGCKRSVALGKLDKLEGREIYLGISTHIKNYFWARHTYE